MQQLYNGKFYETDDACLAAAKIGTLLKQVQVELNLKNDAELSRVLKITPGQISKLRHRVQPLSHLKMVRISEATGWSIYKIREILGA